MQNLKEDMGTGIKPSLEDSEAVGKAADKANVVQEIVTPMIA